MSSNEESISRRSYPGHAEALNVSHSAAAAGGNGGPNCGTSSSSPSVKIGVPLVVSTTSSSTITTALASPVNPNKKHNLGYRIRRLLFPQTIRSTPVTTLSSKQKSSKDVENENQNFLKYSTSLYSTSSGDSDQHRSSSKRRNTRNQSQQTDTLPDFVPFATPSTAPPPQPNAQGLLECSICLLEQTVSQFPELSTCNHRVCLSCLRQYLRIEIFESRINITCPECTEKLHPNDIKIILRNDLTLVDKYESFMVRRILITDPDARWCPAPDCDYCVIASGCASCPKLKCERPGCETLFCYHCKQEWHASQTCDQARAQRGTGRLGGPTGTKAGGVTFSNRGTDAQGNDQSFLQRDDIKPCPCCKVLIIKMDDGSCNHMTCSVCGTEFCWLCMQKISDLHYLSPSGCTFWGKKPWSRKKKIMWQLGMLVGAPVGIALIAGIAVPAIIIGIPVWVGRKLYARFERNHLSRHKSNLMVTAGVITSICVSPILAAVAVGIGVPILLAYVYGVVPISLCRSGGCGVITSSSGVRIELDEDEISANVAPDGVSVDTALSGHRGIANPSIGEVSLGMSTSLSIGSSSHLDRVVLDIQPDRESSSIAACAGSITSNTLTNHMVHGVSLNHNKLETQADIISNKRFSFSSQNADATSVTLSFGDRSINTNISVDDASLKVLTGSIRDGSSQSNNANYSLSPVEVHVNICNNDDDDNMSENAAPHSSSMGTQSPPTKPKQVFSSTQTNTILGKYESRSLEYLTSNYCKICHKSHKPCCPNFQTFQHPNSAIKIGKIAQVQENASESTRPLNSDGTAAAGDKIKSNDTLSEAENTARMGSSVDMSQCEESLRQVAIDCDSKLPQLSPSLSHSGEPSSSSSSAPFGGGSLSGSKRKPKALSQIFYPSSHYVATVSSAESVQAAAALVCNSSSPKPGLSHSLSFTLNNNNNLIAENKHPNYML